MPESFAVCSHWWAEYTGTCDALLPDPDLRPA